VRTLPVAVVKLVFLAILVYEAWFIPHPLKPPVAQ
jgi:hypothetical protein